MILAGGVGFAAGLFDQALDLHNNGSQFAVRPIDDASYDFGANDFTVQVWVNFNDTSREQTLIEKFSGCCGPGWTLTKLNGNALHFFASPAIVLTSAQLSIPSGIWHHILVRRSGTLYQIIYDGSVVAEGANPGSVPNTTMPLLIGKRNQDDGRNFAVDGRIDEVAIWSRALSDAEIALLFNGGNGNPVASDTDGDGILDDDDNCANTSNPDQADFNGDGAGDACDDDDDNDMVFDGADNCPLFPNADQADFNGDGVGDACDDDDDGDQVVDGADGCPNTLAGEVVNASGCAIAQLCPCENAWKNHGAYVSCVAHAAEDFVAAGLITAAEKDATVSEAAQSSCGQQK